MREDPDRGFLCIDWDDKIEPMAIQGTSSQDDFQRIDIALVPCNYVHTMFDYEDDSVSPECIGSLEE